MIGCGSECHVYIIACALRMWCELSLSRERDVCYAGITLRCACVDRKTVLGSKRKHAAKERRLHHARMFIKVESGFIQLSIAAMSRVSYVLTTPGRPMKTIFRPVLMGAE